MVRDLKNFISKTKIIMKRYFNLLFLVFFIISCNNDDYKIYIEKKDYKKALKIVEEKFKTKPDKFLLSDLILLLDQNFYETEKAVDYVRKYQSKGGDFKGIENIVGTLYYNYALSFYKKGELDSSEYYSNEAERLSGENYKIYLLLGKINVRKEKYDIAKDLFLKALKLETRASEIYKYLGNIEFLKNRFNNAEYYYKEGLKVDSNDVQIQMNLSELYLKMKKEKEGILILKKVIELDSTYLDAFDRLIKYYYLKGNNDSIEKYIRIYEKKSKIKAKLN